MRFFPSLFTTTTQERALCISVNDYNLVSRDIKTICPSVKPGEESLYSYLQEKRYLKDGYTHVIFNDVDFTQSNSINYILPIVCDKYRFIRAIFTIEQVSNLINRHFDLSESEYHVLTPISQDDYEDLYKASANIKLQKGLHGVRVNFDNYNLTTHFSPNDYIACCNPYSLCNTRLRQNQFDLLLDTNRKILDLSRIILEQIDIKRLIEKYNAVISFNRSDLVNSEGCVCLENTSIQNAIMDVATLALCATSPKYYAWFEKENLTITIRVDVNLRNEYVDINVDAFVSHLEQTYSDFFRKLSEALIEQSPQNRPFNVDRLSRAEKFLWAMYVAHKIPDAICTQSVLKLLGITTEIEFTNRCAR